MKLRNPGPELTEKDIAAFEAEYDVSLPEDYKAFLLVSNGGSPCGSWAYEDDHEILTFIKLLPDQFSGLRRAIREIGEFAAHLVPFAVDDSENHLCVASNRTGVFVAEYEYSDEGVPKDAKIRQVADSLGTFLEKLVELS